jgi:hypothetical protein
MEPITKPPKWKTPAAGKGGERSHQRVVSSYHTADKRDSTRVVGQRDSEGGPR